jgi:hypothetical protein
MSDFLKNVIEGNGITPSEICLQSFNQHFKNAINVEWFNKEDYYEAIFYQNDLEHIAIYSLSGVLKEYRQNLPSDYLPESIKKIALENGEIMNSVLKNKGNSLEYEIITRDKQLIRYLLIISDVGKIIKNSVL